jgi:adenine-specific DNA-methyltransferase
MVESESLENKRIKLLDYLDATNSQAERNKLGQFATPPPLASEIIDYALSLLQPGLLIRFLEPGFGTGPFYSALRSKASERVVRAVGYEIDPHYANPVRELWKGCGLELHNGDFANTIPPQEDSEKFDLVICNPPYVRHHHLSPLQKQQMQASLARYINIELNGLSGLYTYFMLLSQAWMTTNGIGVWLVPSEFMDVNYGSKVKEFLLRRVTLLRIHRFDPYEVQFNDALVSSAVVVFKNCHPTTVKEVQFSFGGTLLKPVKSDFVKVEVLDRSPKWSQFPKNLAKPTDKPSANTLRDLFSIKRGIATGCNSFFIITKQQAEELKIPKQFLVPILPGPRDLGEDYLHADENGDPKIAHQRFLISCDLPETLIQSEHPNLWQYFQKGIEQGISERYLCQHRTPWYSQEIRPPSPFLCTYMGRSSSKSKSPFRFILNASKATAPNVYLMLYPKPVLENWLDGDPKLFISVWEALCSITAETLIGEGRIYGGGLYKLEPKELANVPAEIVLGALKSKKGFELPKQLELFPA